MEARIPFNGFYESMWSGGIDNEQSFGVRAWILPVADSLPIVSNVALIL